MKRILAVLMTAIMLFSLTACSGSDEKQLTIEKNDLPLNVQQVNDFLAAEDICWVLDGEQWQTDTPQQKATMILTTLPQEMQTNDHGEVLQPGMIMGMLAIISQDGGHGVNYLNYGGIRKIKLDDSEKLAKAVKTVCRVYGIQDEEIVLRDITEELEKRITDRYVVKEFDYGSAFVCLEYLVYSDSDEIERITINISDEIMYPVWLETAKNREEKLNRQLQ